MNSSSLKLSPTVLLIVLNVAVYCATSVVTVARGGSLLKTESEIIQTIGQSNERVLKNWAYWQLFTAMFVHNHLLHIFMNMLFLLIFGLRAEKLFSVTEYFFIYFVSGLTGNVLTLLLPRVVSAGASGALFGLFGASTIYIRRAVGHSVVEALIYSFILLIITSLSPNINIIAHFGGLASGLVIGYVLARKRECEVVYRFSYQI
jgi:rhomboid protease GluP